MAVSYQVTRSWLSRRAVSQPLIVKAASKCTALKSFGDGGLFTSRLAVTNPQEDEVGALGEGKTPLVNTKTAEEEKSGPILISSLAKTKPQEGDDVAFGEGRTIGINQFDIGSGAIRRFPKKECFKVRPCFLPKKECFVAMPGKWPENKWDNLVLM